MTFYAYPIVGNNNPLKNIIGKVDEDNQTLTSLKHEVGKWRKQDEEKYLMAVNSVCGTLPHQFHQRPCSGFAFQRGGRPASRAYAKLWEMFENLPIRCHVKEAAFLCEAPGGFIQATRDIVRPFSGAHNVQLSLSEEWHFIAVSLDNEIRWKLTQEDQRFGHILNLDIHSEIVDRLVMKTYQGRCQLVTADGGFEIDYNKESQENATYDLIRREFEIALHLLDSSNLESTCIVKIFDTEFENTQKLIAYVANRFHKAWLVKPNSSRSINSERYFVGIGLRNCHMISSHICKVQSELKKRQCRALQDVQRVFCSDQ